MSERNGYDHGTPNWIDLMTPDVEGAKTFYTSLFGWSAQDLPGPDGDLMYVNMEKDGKLVCGMGPQQEQMAGMPPIWNSYVCVDDAEQIAKSVEAAGGSVMMPPMQVMEEGTMAAFADPGGAAFCVWQPANHKGAAVVNEPDTYAWNELMTRDLQAAKPFYSEVFGWEFDEMDMGESGVYHVVKGGEEGGLAGMMEMPDSVPEDIPNYWGVYFIVADAGATAATAKELGATIIMGPSETPAGMIAVIADPQGGTFSVMQPPAEG